MRGLMLITRGFKMHPTYAVLYRGAIWTSGLGVMTHINSADGQTMVLVGKFREN